MMTLLIVCLGPACFTKLRVHRNRTHTFELKLAEAKMSDGLVEQAVADSGEKIYLHKEAIITADDIDDANATQDGRGGYQVNVRFSADGARKMEKATGENISKRLAIIFDGKVRSAPTIQSPISSACNITGAFTRESAEDLAKALRGD